MTLDPTQPSPEPEHEVAECDDTPSLHLRHEYGTVQLFEESSTYTQRFTLSFAPWELTAGELKDALALIPEPTFLVGVRHDRASGRIEMAFNTPEHEELLLDDPDLVREYRRQALNRAQKHYRWEDVVQQHAQVYAHILQPNKGVRSALASTGD